jgi:chromosome partitioning protein
MTNPTQIVAVVNGKGGVGKSTVAVNLAVAMSLAGKAVCIIDLDPQVTASKWRDRRKDENPAVVAPSSARLRQTLDAARAAHVDFVVIDTAGHFDNRMVDSAKLADLVLIPTSTSIVDIEALQGAREMLDMANSPPAFVLLNKIHPTATKQADEARETIRQLFGLVCAPVHLCQRAAYAEALTPGLTPQEIDTEGKAADELARLYEFVADFLNAGARTHGEDAGHSRTA